MALPTGTISLSQVNTELGRSSSAAISLGETAVRGLAGKTSGAVSMNDLRGKSARTVSISLIGNTIVQAGFQNQYYRMTFALIVSDGAAITSRLWHGSVSYESNGNGVYETPPYNPNGFTRQENGIIYCTVVIAGTTYEVQYSFTYTAGDEFG